jgi:hypothetical protein
MCPAVFGEKTLGIRHVFSDVSSSLNTCPALTCLHPRVGLNQFHPSNQYRGPVIYQLYLVSSAAASLKCRQWNLIRCFFFYYRSGNNNEIQPAFFSFTTTVNISQWNLTRCLFCNYHSGNNDGILLEVFSFTIKYLQGFH